MVKGVLINLDNVKHFEKTESSRYIAVYYLNDPNPLLLPFDSPAEAHKWFDVLRLLFKAHLKTKVVDANVDLSKLN
jgi:hypothetical protein